MKTGYNSLSKLIPKINQLSGFLLWITLLCGCMLYSLPLLSVEPIIEQEMTLPEQILIGSPLQLNILITTNLQQEVFHPVKDTLGVFSIIGIHKRETREDEILLSRFTYQIAPFETGEQRFPSLSFEIFDHETGNIEIIRSQPVDLVVSSVLIDEDMELRDISGPLKLRLSFWDYILPIAILILLAGIVILIWKKISGKVKISIPEIEIDPRPPYIKALELLEGLKQDRLLEKGEYLDYYFRLSYILRYFLELNYNFNAVEMTSSEITQQIENLPTEERLEINRFLKETDMVKFARFVPYVNKALEHTTWLENYLKSFTHRLSEDKPDERS